MVQRKSRKIYDIVPPSEVKNFPFTALKKKKAKKEAKTAKSISKGKAVVYFHFNLWPLATVIILIFLGVISYLFFNKAEIKIQPKLGNLDFKGEIVAAIGLSGVDSINKIIPANLIEKEEEMTESFLATGKFLKEEKAEGIIRVYNADSASLQILIVNTRFVSSEGKLFRLLERVTIPGGKYEGGKLAPGYLDIKVRADQPGEEYNIGPSTFSLPGLVGTRKYTTVYGKSSSPMTGGLKTEVLQVTKDDLNSAKEILSKKLSQKIKEDLLNQFGSSHVIFEDAYQEELIDAFSPVPPRAPVASFIYQVKIKYQALLFRKSDLEELTKNLILADLPSDKKSKEDSLRLNYSFNSADFKAGKILFGLEGSSMVYSPLEESALQESLKGKSLAETQLFLRSQPDVINIQINTWPFINRLPKNANNIKINVVF